MYVYVLQTENGKIEDEDVFSVKKIIDRCAFNTYRIALDINSISTFPVNHKKYVYIPIGSIEFVSKWLKFHENINELKPIEIPESLMSEEFLQRNYAIFPKNIIEFFKKNIVDDEKGQFINLSNYLRKNVFIKNISHLKSFSYIGKLKYLNFNEIPDGNYAISEYVNIVSEYRIFVDEMNIKGIQFYDGDCKTFPNVNTIQKMINKYYTDKNKPDSYTLDVAVINKNNTLYTTILEIHPVCSVGLYGFSDSSLLKMYADGIKWYKNQKY